MSAEPKKKREPRIPKTREPRSRDELFKLAEQVERGEVFGSWMLPPPHAGNMALHFPVLMFGAKFPLDTVHVYAPMSAALARGINGYPMMGSAAALNRAEVDILREMLAELEAARTATRERLTK